MYEFIQQFYIDIKQMHFIIFLRIHKLVMAAYLENQLLITILIVLIELYLWKIFSSKFAYLNYKPNKRTILTWLKMPREIVSHSKICNNFVELSITDLPV